MSPDPKRLKAQADQEADWNSRPARLQQLLHELQQQKDDLQEEKKLLQQKMEKMEQAHNQPRPRGLFSFFFILACS